MMSGRQKKEDYGTDSKLWKRCHGCRRILTRSFMPMRFRPSELSIHVSLIARSCSDANKRNCHAAKAQDDPGSVQSLRKRIDSLSAAAHRSTAKSLLGDGG